MFVIPKWLTLLIPTAENSLMNAKLPPIWTSVEWIKN